MDTYTPSFEVPKEENQKHSKMLVILFALLCGVLLGWFIIIALFRGDIPVVQPTTEDILRFMSRPSGEPLTNPDLSTEEVLLRMEGSSGSVTVPVISTDEVLQLMSTPSGDPLIDSTVEMEIQ